MLQPLRIINLARIDTKTGAYVLLQRGNTSSSRHKHMILYDAALTLHR